MFAVSLGCPRVLGVSFGCLVTELNVTQPKLSSSRFYLIHITQLLLYLISPPLFIFSSIFPPWLLITYFTTPTLLTRFTANARSVFFCLVMLMLCT